jgi:peptide chain release factor
VFEVTEGTRPDTLLSATLVIKGDADRITVRWRGTIQWACPSPFRPRYGRRNWFIRVDVFATPRVTPFLGTDIRVETMRASGPGGQHVNKTESAVRAIHVPTGLTATSMAERSQLMNHKLAIACLAAMIANRDETDRKASRRDRWMAHNTLERGNPVRVFRGPDFREFTVMG